MLALKAVLLPAPTVDPRLPHFAQFLCNVSPFRINTSKNVSKQSTLTPFKMNTYEKSAGWGRVHFLLPPIVHAARAKRLNSFPFIQLRTLLPFFAPAQNSTLLFSSNSALFRKNTRGWGAPLLNALLNRHSPRPIWRFKFFFFSRLSQLSAMNLSPCALPFLRGCILFMPRSAAGFSSRPPAASIHRHVHGRQQRKSTGNATERLPVPLRLQLQPQGYRPQLFVARFVQRFSRHGHVAAHAYPPGLAGSASPVPLQPRQFAGSLCRTHYASWFADGFSGADCRAPSRIRKLFSSAANRGARNGFPQTEPIGVLAHGRFALRSRFGSSASPSFAPRRSSTRSISASPPSTFAPQA